MELTDQHMYRDQDGSIFQAVKHEGSSVALTLFRVNIYNRQLVYPIVAGSLIGYIQDGDGMWHIMRVGDPKYTKQAKVVRPYPSFEDGILPNLECIASGADEYLKTL